MKRRHDWIYFLPAFGISIGIFSLSTFLSVPIQIEGVSYLDKWEHMFAYFALSLSFLWAFSKTGRLSTRISRWIMLASMVYGIMLEFVQFYLFANRFFDWADAVANMLGVVLGYLIFTRMRRDEKRA